MRNFKQNRHVYYASYFCGSISAPRFGFNRMYDDLIRAANEYFISINVAWVAIISLLVSIISMFIAFFNAIKSRPILRVIISPPGKLYYGEYSFESITFYVYNIGGSAFSIINYEIRIYEGIFSCLFRTRAQRIKGNGSTIHIEEGKLPTFGIKPENCPPYVIKADAPKRFNMHVPEIWKRKKFIKAYIYILHSNARRPIRYKIPKTKHN